MFKYKDLTIRHFKQSCKHKYTSTVFTNECLIVFLYKPFYTYLAF